ncbi:Beta-galactosidase-1-like protein [Tieghemiomyces parasiticus]|uniref:Beta-galactosidase n=1 Tax=Tieghemiomyces parasiticus TaxID=78921 RepID=A0A9W8AEX9_9FUNG|nr:Beta-galactosidase-1-like protein [Tieghemiomyces parasiticus]
MSVEPYTPGGGGTKTRRPRPLLVALCAGLALGLAAVLWTVPFAQHPGTVPAAGLPAVAHSLPPGTVPAYPHGPYKVGVTHRAITINDKPLVLMAGCIHYPRSTPSMWPELMRKSKAAGINTIETYVFWNQHEPERGNWDFSTGSRNLPLFLRLAREHGLYVNLRLGPYVCSEWQYGGFPDWLRLVPGIQFRTWNEPFQREMERFIRKMVDVVADYMPEHGGPIIMMQVENEYGNYQWMYGEDGNRFARWCGELTQRLNTTVPWIMCRQWSDVPNVIPTHNDFYCHHYLGDFFRKFPNFPGMWTENWPGWFQRWGEARPTRPVRDIAYAVARWFASGGSYHAYYMWHGGTNFGRTSGPLVTTSYDYDVMLDEYGLERYPKYHHLQRLHQLMFDYSDALLTNEVAQPIVVGDHQVEAYEYGSPTSPKSIIFLINADEKQARKVTYRGLTITVPRWSVAILAGGHLHPRLLYTTAQIDKSYPKSQLGFEVAHRPSTGRPYLDAPVVTTVRDRVPANRAACSQQFDRPQEQLSLTDDRTDYLWYVTDFEVDHTHPAPHTLVITKVYEIVLVYVDGNLVGLQRGSERNQFDLGKLKLGDRPGTHSLQILVVTMGWTNGEKRMEEYHRGILGTVHLDDRDMTNAGWGHLAGLDGEDAETLAAAFANPETGAHWDIHTDPNTAAQYLNTSLAWHRLKFTFDSDLQDFRGVSPFALDLASMTKGFVLVNGHHIGRYWLVAGESPDADRCRHCDYAGWFNPDQKCRTDCGEPSQRYYHVPHDWLKPAGAPNEIVLFEEVGGDPREVVLVNRVHQRRVRKDPDELEGEEETEVEQPPDHDHGQGKDRPSWMTGPWPAILWSLFGVGLVAITYVGWRHARRTDGRGETQPLLAGEQ